MNTARHRTRPGIGARRGSSRANLAAWLAYGGFFALGVLLMIPLLQSLSFSSNPSITPAAAVTNDTLNCEWTPAGAGTITANVTWRNGSAIFRNETGIACTAGSACSTANDIEGQYVRRNEVWNCTVTLYNTTNATNATASVTVANADPRLQSFPSVTTPEDTAFSLTVNATDPDGDSLTWFSNDQNYSDDLFAIGSDTGLISFTPNMTSNGNHTMTLIAIDNNNGSASIAVNFEIKPRNDPPTVTTSITSQTATEATAYQFLLTGSDEENQTFVWELNSSSPSTLVLNNISNTQANISFSSSNASPRFQDAGNYTVTFVIYQAANKSSNSTYNFSLNITAINHAPNFTSAVPNRTGTQNATFALELNATDADGTDTLSFNVTAVNCSLPNPWNLTLTKTTLNATAWINHTLSNDHVVCNIVNVSVTDNKTETWQYNNFSITNVNDQPEIFNHSQNSTNTASGNLTNLTRGLGGTFRYAVNASDNDSLTTAGEVLTYRTNDTLFPINSSSGEFNFVMNSSHIGNFTVRINVSDDEGAWRTFDAFIQGLNNSVPSLFPLAGTSCAEGVSCSRILDANDTDASETLTFASNDSTRFPIGTHNATAARLNTTFNQDLVGNWSINVSVTDSMGALDFEVFTFEINNTNDAPFFDSNANNVSNGLNVSPIIEGRTTLLLLNVTDPDLYLSETLTFNFTVLNATDSSIINISKLTANTTRLNITPGNDAQGNYTLNVTVTDAGGRLASLMLNFTVHNQSAPANFTSVQPHFNASQGITVFDFAPSEAFANNQTRANFSENRTVSFNVTISDSDTAANNITLRWYLDGNLNKTSNASNHTGVDIPFNLFHAGTHNVTVVASDHLAFESSWTFNVTVRNLNRAPTLVTHLFNFTNGRSINQTTTYNDYFSFINSAQRLLDPDDDVNGNNQIANNVSDPNETWSLTMTAGSCSVATLTISGDDIQIKPTSVGTCLVQFTATDGNSSTALSNNVTIEVGDIPDEETESVTTTSSGGGAGGGSGSTTTVRRRTEVEVEVDTPKPLKILTPGKLIIYQNKTMTVPVLIKNTWNASLFDVKLSAEAKAPNVSISFTTDFISELPEGEEILTEMTVTNYRGAGPYEIVIRADVADPAFTDTGTIFVNSIERSDEGDDVQSRVTFARDLLQNNQECRELNVLVDQAIEEIRASNLDAAIQLVDAAINGCKYLINARAIREQPAMINLGLFQIARDYVNIILFVLGALILLTLITLIVIKVHTPREEE